MELGTILEEVLEAKKKLNIRSLGSGRILKHQVLVICIKNHPEVDLDIRKKPGEGLRGQKQSRKRSLGSPSLLEEVLEIRKNPERGP